MSFLGGIMKSLVNPMSLMQLAMGPAGWASLAMKTIGTAVAQQVIQQLGQKLGLPQSVIGMAQQAFSAATGSQGMPSTVREAVGQLAGQLNLSPRQQGELERGGNKAVNTLVQNMLDRFTAEAKKFGEGKKSEAANSQSTSGKKGFLYAIAEALGKAIDQQMDNMVAAADKIKLQVDANQTQADKLTGLKGEQLQAAIAQNSTGQQKLGSLNADLTAASQQMSILSNVVSTTLKSIGEAQTTIARKG